MLTSKQIAGAVATGSMLSTAAINWLNPPTDTETLLRVLRG